MSRPRFTLITGLALMALSLGFLSVRTLSAGRPIPVDLRAPEGPTLGSPEADELIFIVSDYRCPHCRAFEHNVAPHLSPLLEQGQLRVTYLNVAALGAESELAARASLCAARAGAFANFHPPLFDLQEVTEPALLELAQQQGLAPAVLETCLADPQTAQEVARTTALVEEAGIRGTPTVVVDGLAYPGPSWRELQDALAR